MTVVTENDVFQAIVVVLRTKGEVGGHEEQMVEIGIYQFHYPLQRSHTLPMSHDSHFARGELIPIDHFLGDPAGYHYVAVTKIP